MQKRPSYRRLIGPRRCKTKKKKKEKVAVEVVNYNRRFLDSIENVEYPEASRKRDQRVASGWERKLVETNDRNLADPFIELVAESWKVSTVFGFLEKKKQMLPSHLCDFYGILCTRALKWSLKL